MMELPRSFRYSSSTDCEQAGLSLMRTSGEGPSVCRRSLFCLGVANLVLVSPILGLASAISLMGESVPARLASLRFLSISWRSRAILLLSAFSRSSSALSSLFDLRSSRTVPMHSMMRLAYSWLVARLSSSSRSMDLKFSIWMRASSSSFRSFSFSSFSSLISRAFRSMFTLTLLRMRAADSAYCSVASVSSRQSGCGLTQAIRQVRQLPPNARFRIDVSFESRQGMYCSFRCVLISSSATTTFRRKNSDLLISMASLVSLPTGLKTRSDPARSTKQACRDRQLPSSSASSIVTMKMECDREEQSWILLLATTRLRLPTFHSRIISSALLHSRSLRSSITNSRSTSHRIRSPLSFCGSAPSMSAMRSLYSWMKEHFRCESAVLFAKMSATAWEMMPGVLASPSKANVLPEPVCPQVSTVTLQPSTKRPTSQWMQQSVQMGWGLQLASWIMSTWTLCTSSPGSATATSFPYGLTVTMLLPPAAGFTFIPTRIDAFFIIHHQQLYYYPHSYNPPKKHRSWGLQGKFIWWGGGGV